MNAIFVKILLQIDIEFNNFPAQAQYFAKAFIKIPSLSSKTRRMQIN